jgi:CNT family concentrative nucleoside transporter
MSMGPWISFGGMFILMALAWAGSTDRRTINWRAVGWGTALQLLFAALIFRVPGSSSLFMLLNDLFLKLLAAAQEGPRFVFGALGGPESPIGFSLAFQSLPLIIFFSALMGLLYYWRVMPLLIRGFAWIFTRLMRVSGAESLCAASNVFMGIESFTAIRPFLSRMTRSEYGTILTAGMATIASSTLGLYVLFLKDIFPGIAGHLMSASILSAPAALVMSKLILPETGEPVTRGLNLKLDPPSESSALDAILQGAMAGLQMTLGIVAVLVAFLGLLGVVNMILNGAGRELGADLSLQHLLGWCFRPLAWLMGIPPADAVEAGNLLGLRLVATEIPAYQQLAAAIQTGAFTDPRTPVIMAYALCGFTHVASLAIFTGGAVALAPERRSDILAAGPRALVAATLACLMTGAVAGVFARGGHV